MMARDEAVDIIWEQIVPMSEANPPRWVRLDGTPTRALYPRNIGIPFRQFLERRFQARST